MRNLKYSFCYVDENLLCLSKYKFHFSPTRPDLQFSLHKTMLWLMVAKLATIKSRKIFMYIVALYGNE